MSTIKRGSVPGAGGELKAPEFYVQMAPSEKSRCCLLDRPSVASYRRIHAENVSIFPIINHASSWSAGKE